jgi:hypothetical protein
MMTLLGGSPTPPEPPTPSPLPSGYTLLTYAETPLGTSAYINTGVVASNTIGFEIDAMTYDSNATSGYGCLFGGRVSSNSSDFQLSTYSSSSSYKGTLRRGNSSRNYNAHLTKDARFTASLSGNTYTIDGNSYTTAANISSGKTIYLFALNNNGTATQHGHIRVYGFKLYNGTTKLIDYIPCKNPSDVVGFYDLVNEVFVAPTSGTLVGVI